MHCTRGCPSADCYCPQPPPQPVTNPAKDPIGTVRVRPGQDPTDPHTTRRIKVVATKYPPYNGEGWFALSFHEKHGFAETGGNTWTNDEQPADWPVQRLAEVARVLGHPAPEPVEDTDTRVFTDTTAPPLGEQLLLKTDADQTIWWDGKRWRPSRDSSMQLAEAWPPDRGGTYRVAAPSTMDTSARERIIEVLRSQLPPTFSALGRDFVADQLLAALPELAEIEQLRTDLRAASAVAETEGKRAEYWRKTCSDTERQRDEKLRAARDRLADDLIDTRGERDRWRQRCKEVIVERLQLETDLGILRGAVKQYRLHWERATAANVKLLDDPKTATAAENADLRAKLTERNRAYGRASTTIGQLRSELARTKDYYLRTLGGLNAAGERQARPAQPTDVITDYEAAAHQRVQPRTQRPHIGARVSTPKGFGRVVESTYPKYPNLVTVRLDPKPDGGEVWEFNVAHVAVIAP